MKKPVLILLVTILSLNGYSQISFEKGYYIDDSDQKVDCLIKNIDWRFNPTEFEYKLSENAEQKTATIKSIKEFGIYNISKYTRHSVQIDKSSDIVDQLSVVRNPIFEEEQLFLKVLVEGKANLYLFEEKNLERFFYNKDSSEVKQLIYKRYRTSDDKVGTNTRFKQTLLYDLKCETVSSTFVEKMSYQLKDLVNLFVKYNECTDSKFISFQSKKDLFNLKILTSE